MDSIAKKFGIHVSQLRDVNSLADTKRMHASQPVLVPINYTTHSNAAAKNINVAGMENTDIDNKSSANSASTHKVKTASQHNNHNAKVKSNSKIVHINSHSKHIEARSHFRLR